MTAMSRHHRAGMGEPKGRKAWRSSKARNDPVVEQLMAVVEAQHGERMDDADREIVRKGIERNLTNTAALAAYPLVNGDEPGSSSAPIRGSERWPMTASRS